MPDARVQLSIQIETEGAEQLTALRRQLEGLGETGREALAPLEASFTGLVRQLADSRQVLAALEPAFRNFFQNLITHARSFRDAFKQLLLDLLQYFLRILRQMLEAWISGMQLMSSASSGGFSGGFSFSFPSFSPPAFAPPGFATTTAPPGPALAPRLFSSGPGGGTPAPRAPQVNIGPIIVPGARDPQATAAAVIREIRRRARDQGMRLPL